MQVPWKYSNVGSSPALSVTMECEIFHFDFVKIWFNLTKEYPIITDFIWNVSFTLIWIRVVWTYPRLILLEWAFSPSDFQKQSLVVREGEGEGEGEGDLYPLHPLPRSLVPGEWYWPEDKTSDWLFTLIGPYLRLWVNAPLLGVLIIYFNLISKSNPSLHHIYINNMEYHEIYPYAHSEERWNWNLNMEYHHILFWNNISINNMQYHQLLPPPVMTFLSITWNITNYPHFFSGRFWFWFWFFHKNRKRKRCHCYQ